jgi:hypothetical protein
MKLDDEEKKSLCIAAKEFASLDGMVNVKPPERAYKVNKYLITDTREKSEPVVGMRCETIPRSHLLLDYTIGSERGIRILLKTNNFESRIYWYDVQMVLQNPKLVPSPDGKFSSLYYAKWIIRNEIRVQREKVFRTH